mgnify:CR=1 FL=1
MLLIGRLPRTHTRICLHIVKPTRTGIVTKTLKVLFNAGICPDGSLF